MRRSSAAGLLALATAASLIAAAPASAQQTPPPPVQTTTTVLPPLDPAPPPPPLDGWHFTVTPYIWISWPEGNIEAKSGPIGGGIDLPDINVNFDDVSLGGAFTAMGDIRYRNFGVIGDVTYYEIEADKDITIVGDIFVEGEFEVKGTKAMLAGYWRAFDDGRSHLDLLAGVHYLKAETGVDLTTATRVLAGEIEEDWVDPLIGIRGQTAFSDNFGLLGFATYGGFSVSSEELYDLYGAAYWRFNDTFTAELGYRYFTDKFEGDRLTYEISFSGPLLGFAFSF